MTRLSSGGGSDAEHERDIPYKANDGATLGDSGGPGLNNSAAGDTAAGGNGATAANADTRAAMLEARLEYATQGLKTFIVPPGLKESYKSAEYSNGERWGQTCDADQIRRDFANRKWRNANIGLPTGIEAGFFVVEADTIEGHNVDGIANLQALIDANGPLPDTRMHRSPTGSIHLLFKNPPGMIVKNSTSRLAPGVDVLGEGGMVIAPPSIKPGVGQYVCLNPETPIADPTGWLLTMVTAGDDEGDHVPNEDLLADDQEEIIFAFDSLRNDNLNRTDWHDRGMAIWAATDGSEEGFQAFKRFSMKSKKYLSKRRKETPNGATVERWDHWRKYPPDRIGAGSIKHWADEDCPGWRDAYDAIQDEILDQIKLASLAVDQATLDQLLEGNIPEPVAHVVNGQAARVVADLHGNQIETVAIAAPTPVPDVQPAPTPVPHVRLQVISSLQPRPSVKPKASETSGTWFNPVDLWGNFDPPELPTGLLPEIIEQYACIEGANMGCDPAGLAMSALTICAGATSDQIKVRVKQHDRYWTEPARLWSALVGDPSTKKSPIILQAARPLAKIDHKLTRIYLTEKQRYNALSAELKLTTPAPKHPRVKLEDTTIEAAQEVLKDSPNGVLLLQDELSGFFGAMDKYSGRGSSADRAFWMKAYNGGAATFNRIGRGSGYIPNLSVSMLGGIQPDAVRKTAADGIDDGLLQRELFIVLRPATVDQDKPRGPFVEQYEKLVGKLHKLKPQQEGLSASDSIPVYLQGYDGPTGTDIDDEDAREQTDTMLRFCPNAQTIRNQLAEKHITMMASELVNKKLATHVGKYDGVFARLCVLWHCIENAARSEFPMVVSEDTAQRVARFLHEFLFKHAVAFYTGVLGLSDDHDRLKNVAGYILANKLDKITNRDVQRGDSSMRKLTDHDTLKIFEQLEALGWVDRRPPKKPPEKLQWIVNPLVHVQFADRAKQEAERRSAAREVVRDIFKKPDRPDKGGSS